MQRLLRDEIVRTEPDGKFTRYYLVAKAEEVLRSEFDALSGTSPARRTYQDV
jgi:hypothetical protein